ncbi:hypothetical protein ACFL96_10405 [Thermoproteota archaeon]
MFEIYKGIKNSLHGLTSALKIAISNADNFNTPGYKYSFATFSTVFNDVMNPGSESTNPISVGTSMTLGSTTTDFSQGHLGFGTKMDTAIVGDGFFILSKSAHTYDESAPHVYSRAGRFLVDFDNKYVTDSFGRKVYGYKIESSGVTNYNQLIPIETEGETDIGFIDGGVLVGNFEARKNAIDNGDPNPPAYKPLYRLAISSFKNKQGLILGEGSIYEATPASGPSLDPGISGEGMYGDVLAERLESSNVDVAKVALDMNLLNRGFSAVQGVVDDVNKILTGIISKLSS